MSNSKESPSAFVFSLDRFEGECAVLYQGETEQIVPRGSLPKTAKEGQCFVQDENGRFCLDAAATNDAQAAMKARVQALLQRKKRTF